MKLYINWQLRDIRTLLAWILIIILVLQLCKCVLLATKLAVRVSVEVYGDGLVVRVCSVGCCSTVHINTFLVISFQMFAKINITMKSKSNCQFE
jgi:hypothetical protein